MSRIGLTGATGFVGGKVLASLRAAGYEVRALVRGGAKIDGVDCREWDLAAPGGGDDAALAGLDALIHAGAYLPPNYADPAYARRCLEVNALGTLELLERAVGLGLRKVVFFSLGNGYRSTLAPAVETDALYPSERAPYYLASKLCGEIFADHYTRTDRAAVAILRPAAIYGAGMARGTVSNFATALHEGRRVVVHDGGRYSVDLVHVDDVVDATLAALQRPVTGAFNLGSGVASTMLQVALALADCLGRSRDLIEVLPPGEAAPANFAPLSIERARAELGYAPRSLAEGLRDYVKWFS